MSEANKQRGKGHWAREDRVAVTSEVGKREERIRGEEEGGHHIKNKGDKRRENSLLTLPSSVNFIIYSSSFGV